MRKDIHTYKTRILPVDMKVCARYFCKNSVVVIDDYRGGHDIYVCSKFPAAYKGNNPFMDVWAYDEFSGWQLFIFFQNNITRIMWDVFCQNGKRTPRRERLTITDGEARRMMKTETVKKSGSGSRICNNSINSPVAYKQVTSYAYWANLDNAKSGNASVVASNIWN